MKKTYNLLFREINTSMNIFWFVSVNDVLKNYNDAQSKSFESFIKKEND